MIDLAFFRFLKGLAMATNFGQNWHYCSYSACKYNEDHSSPRDYEGNRTFWTRRQKSAYPIEYLNNYYIYLHRLFCFGRHNVDYKTDISFAVAQGTLLW